MGKILALAVLIGGLVHSQAADYRLINSQFIRVYTNSMTAMGTNATTQTNIQDTAASVYHTFHFVYTATGTNAASIAIDRTLDGSDWASVGTLTATSSSVLETNFTGKWVAYRFRTTFLNTNTPTLTIPYMAQ